MVDWVQAGPAARDLSRVRSYDLIILDRMLPLESGDSLLAAWRRVGIGVPILILTAMDAVDDRVAGLRAGADDYLVKPFAFSELLARAEALVRRSAGDRSFPGPELRVGSLLLDPRTGRLEGEDGSVDLSATETRLMEFFMRHPGQVLSRTAIADGCWHDPGEITDNAVEAQIKNLRRRISAVSRRSWLQTRRGFGYLLEERP